MTTPNPKRLIEVAFPLKQVSLDSVHEKNVRHGHISTLHIWPARRPLAASRAALIATLLPDPGDAEERRDLLLRLAGRVTEKVERKRVNGRMVEKMKEETEGGILHWGRENGPDLDWFRQEIRRAYGGRAPKVLDPFAGGGAIPLEAMRLGCEVTAMDINPVAWFILKCTLEYPQKLAGQTRPLPDFALADPEFMEAFLKAKGFKGARLRTFLERLGHGRSEGVQLGDLSQEESLNQAVLAWHVRAWGRWVLARARQQLAACYPTYAQFQPLNPEIDFEPRPLQLLDLDENGVAQLAPLNAEFNEVYLKDPDNPRWVAKPTVAYLWARTVTCKQCRATLPLLKTRWLCKKDNKRVLLTMAPDADRTGVVFGVQPGVPQNGGNGAQRREHDKRIGAGTMSRTGATCPGCGVIMTMNDIRREGQAGRLGAVMTAVVVDGVRGKEYRLPTPHEIEVAQVSEERLQSLYADIPFGVLEEQICAERPSPNSRGASGLPRYGFGTWGSIFTNRQLFALGLFSQQIRNLQKDTGELPKEWLELLVAYLAPTISRMADRGSAIATWTNDRETIRSTFARFALPMVWDFAESCPLAEATGGFIQAIEWIARVIEHLQEATAASTIATTLPLSATGSKTGRFDLICTDPPYYDAIPYSDLMDFFHVWIRRVLHGIVSDEYDVFESPLGPKWNHESNDGELVDQPSRFEFDTKASQKAYEDGMLRAFRNCLDVLEDGGRLVVAFANKQPQAWETLVSALIRSGFVVDGSWPIQTEMQSKVAGGARLSSSIWLVCKKRQLTRPGWDNAVLDEMRENIIHQLHNFWDAGIRGPDFVWAATGPALEAFSKYPAVRKANAPGETMTVSEFLREVRRMVVDFVVGRVLTKGGEQAVTGLDDVTTYYLLHRNDFGLDDAPVGGCILYALSCNLSDAALANQYDLLLQSRNGAAADNLDEAATEDADEEDDNGESGSGAKVKLKPWHRRQGRSLGLEAPGGRPAPLIDQVHKLMHLWRAGDQVRVNEYLDGRGLQRNPLFHQLLQALIELAPAGSDERAVLEAISNHAAAHGDVRAPRYRQPRLVRE